jgi:muramoyltetrapeptide carboxypeptidase
VNLLFGKSPGVIFSGLIPMNGAARREGVVTGGLSGGNLRIVQTSLGLAWQCQTKDKILFFEDVDERGYSIDRMLEQLYGSGLLNQGPRAVVFGDFTGSVEKNGNDHSLFALETFARRVTYPVFRGVPSGHGAQLNHTLPFNTSATLITGAEGLLSLASGGA